MNDICVKLLLHLASLINIFAESLLFQFLHNRNCRFFLEKLSENYNCSLGMFSKNYHLNYFLACSYHFQQISLILAEAIPSALTILSLFISKKRDVTNREIQLTSLDPKKRDITSRGIQLTTCDPKNVTVTNTGPQPTF